MTIRAFVYSLLGLLVAIGVVALGRVIIAFNRKRRRIIHDASAASQEQLQRIYALVEKVGVARSNGSLLARTNLRTDDPRLCIPLAADLEDFPWAGRTVTIDVGDEVVLRVSDDSCAAPILAGRIYQSVRVPRLALKKNGKEQNVYMPARYLKARPELIPELRQVCAAYPEDLLAFLLCAGRESFEFDPIDQARVGSSPSWIQDPQWQPCEKCGKRMRLIAQVPGAMLGAKRHENGTFYLFGCAAHPEQVRQVRQST